MYFKQIEKKASPALRTMPTHPQIATSPSYDGSLSNKQAILAKRPDSGIPEFKGISAQLKGDCGPNLPPIQRKEQANLAKRPDSGIPEFKGISAQLRDDYEPNAPPIQRKEQANLARRPDSGIPEFKGISAQLRDDYEPNLAPIQRKQQAILAKRQDLGIPEFKGISAQLRDDYEPNLAPIQRKEQANLAKRQDSGIPEFKGISAQLRSNSGSNVATIQTKEKDDINVSEVHSENKTGLTNDLKAGAENLSRDSLAEKIAQTMGQQYGVDTSPIKFTNNSSFPATLGAVATIQGNNIHFRPGHDNEANIKHEVGHYIDNAINGTPKGDKAINGQTIDTTREQAAEKMAQTPLMLKASPGDALGATLEDKLTNGHNETIQCISPTEPEENIPNPFIKTDYRKKFNPTLETIEEYGYVMTLKYDFAGSGEEAWKTHKQKNDPTGEKKGENLPHKSEGLKYGKEETGNKIVREYAGPLAKILGRIKKGAVDSGNNSTENNLKDAKLEFLDIMRTIEQNLKDTFDLNMEELNAKVKVDIKGFSRGGATATVFANWIKKDSKFGKYVDISLVVFDPVPGTGPTKGLGEGQMPKEQDVSSIHNEHLGVDDQGRHIDTTWVLPVKSGHAGYSGSGFSPQKLSGYQRIIIAFGGAKHSFGLMGGLKYNHEENLKGMELSNLPKGLFVVNQKDMQIHQVENREDWEKNWKTKIMKEASSLEKRKKIIKEAVDRFFPKDKKS